MIIEKGKYLYIHTQNTSYVLRILQDGTLMHCYYGARILEEDMDCYNLLIPHTATARLYTGDATASPDSAPLECSGFGRGDYRTPAISIASEDGRNVNEYQYVRHNVIKGKPIIQGLPQTDVNTNDVDTLEIVLKDKITGVEIILSYTSFYEEDVIARHTSITNTTENKVTVISAMSASVDFETDEFEMISLGGRWGSERNIERYPIHYGESSISSRRGMSGHHLNPFFALVRQETCESWGDAYGFSLVYSGDFKLSAEVGQFHGTRVWMGINPETFSWELKIGETFSTPEALLTYSQHGLNGMSQNFHKVCRQHLGACADKTIQRPIVLNLWESFEFNISEEIALQAVKHAKDMGVDTVVIDDGWFGCRNNDSSSMGDWFVNYEKFPNGLKTIEEECNKYGLKLGIWFEPEVISRNSELFRKHPDWCIHIPGVSPVEIRKELMLDFSRSEIVDAVYEAMTAVLSENNISYVKWDMNRSITDNGTSWLPPHRQKEQSHRCMLGTYELMSRLKKTFPHIFFEGCASGGGRFDFGILYYMPQIWTSDNTDALERMKIQHGTSLLYPPETISAHVSECPNSISCRTTPFKSRCDVAQLFSYGYELNPMIVSSEEKTEAFEQSEKHRKIAVEYAKGSFYRLKDPFTSNSCAWQLVSEKGSKSIVLYAAQLMESNYCGEHLKLKGLEDDKFFYVSPLCVIYSGRMLKNGGIPIKQQIGDFVTQMFEISEVKDVDREICVESKN